MVNDERSVTNAPTNGTPPASIHSALDMRDLDFLLWQLADSAFPTGGFAHSSGLEAAWQHGEVRNRVELNSFLEANLDQLGHAALPLVTTAHDELGRLDEL